MERLLGLMPARVDLPARPPPGPWLEVLDEARQRVVAAVEDQVLGQLALLLGDLGVGRMWLGLTIAMSSPASTQW